MMNRMENPAPGTVPPRMRLRCLRWNLHRLTLSYIAIAGIGVWVFDWPALLSGTLAVLLVMLVTDGIARPGSCLFYPTITHGPRDGRYVALSFDDGPDADMTPKVLDALARAGARATFFVIGRSLAECPDLARRIVADGHVLGNHAWGHSRFQSFYSTKKHLREIERCEQAIARICRNAMPALYRPPVGLKSGELGRAAWQRGLTLVAWSLHSHDTRLQDPANIARRVLKRVQAGDIVLLHDGHDLPGRNRPLCAQAVTLILQGLSAKGLECVTIPELLNRQGSAPCQST